MQAHWATPTKTTRQASPCTSTNFARTGAGGISAPWALGRAQLDDHFAAQIVAHVERVNAYFGARLNELLTFL
jgi:hypothetical protein